MRFKAQTAVKIAGNRGDNNSTTNLQMDASNGLVKSDFNANNWSMSYWIYTPNLLSVGQGAPYVFRAGSALYMFNRYNDGQMKFRIGSILFNPSSSAFNDRWNHIVFTRDGSTVTIYHDNSVLTTGTASADLVGTASAFTLGGTSIASQDYPQLKIAQFTFHQKTLTASEISLLYGGVGYEDLNGQQKLDLSILAWHDFMNDSANNEYGKNYNGGSSNYDFTAGDYDKLSLVGGNFAKGITKRTGDRITQITSAGTNSLTLTADTTDLIYVPRYRIRNATTNNSKPVINFNQNNATIRDQWGNDNEDTGQEQHFLLDTEELNGKDLTIIVVHRESNHSGIGTILASKGTSDAESKELWLYSEGGKHKFAYGGTVQSATGHDTMNQSYFNLVVYKLTQQEVKIQHRILHPNFAIKTNTNSLSFSRQTLTNNQISIGARMVNTTTYDKKFGEIAELMLFNRALGDASISTISESLTLKYQSNP